MNDEQLQQENAELKARLSNLESRSQNPTPGSFAPRSPNPAPGLSTPAPDFVDGYANDEIDLRELWAAIWQGKRVIVAITTVFTVCAVLYALSIPDEYKSEVILTPASTSSSSSIGKLAGQFGGLASLAGISLGGSDSGDKTTIAIELIKTWGFLESFIKNNKLEIEVFAAKGWNKLANELLIDETLYDQKTSDWVREIDQKIGGQAEPTSWELFEEIKNRINVSQDKKTGLITLSVEHYSPYVAKRWADLLVEAINKYIQLQDRREALSSIEYLKSQINKTNIAEMKAIFYQLIEEQTKTLMLAEISSEYVLKTLSPAKVAERKSKPKRALIVVLGTMLSGMLAIIFVLIRYFRRAR